MPNIVTIDFETSSEADLKNGGLWNYSNDPTTWPACMAYRINNGFTNIWLPGQEFPQELRECIDNGFEFHAFNAAFEYHIWSHVCAEKLNWPRVPFRLWKCSRAEASYYGLPRGLDNVCRVLDLGLDGKDKAGHKVMMKVVQPNKLKRDIKARGQWGKEREKLDIMWDYCVQDVDCEALISDKLPDLPAIEHKIWQADQAINARGIPVDLDLCRGALAIVQEAHTKANNVCEIVTCQDDGTSVITKPSQLARIKEWCFKRDVFLDDMGADTIKEYLECYPDVDAGCRRLLKARMDTSSAAVKKFKAALLHADSDGLCRNAHDYYAAITGRWGAKGVQFQNLRNVDKDYEVTDETIAMVTRGDFDEVAEHGDPITILANHVRAMVCAPEGQVFVHCDYKSIEARILPWFAQDHETLQQLIDGRCLYSELASTIFNLDVSLIGKKSFERSVGKAGILGLGFKMGAKTFQAQVKAQSGLDLPIELCEDVVRIYREKYKLIVALWRNLEQSAMMAIRNPGTEVAGFGWSYLMIDGYLTVKLPSGRRLYYKNAWINHDGRWGNPEITYTGPSGTAFLSVSVLIENIVQATARDIQANALLNCHVNHVPVVTHVHDSIYFLSHVDNAATSAEFLSHLMELTPEWAAGIPIVAEIEKPCKRFG